MNYYAVFFSKSKKLQASSFLVLLFGLKSQRWGIALGAVIPWIVVAYGRGWTLAEEVSELSKLEFTSVM